MCVLHWGGDDDDKDVSSEFDKVLARFYGAKGKVSQNKRGGGGLPKWVPTFIRNVFLVEEWFV